MNLGMAPAGVELSQFANVGRNTAIDGAGADSSTGRDQRQDPHQHP